MYRQKTKLSAERETLRYKYVSTIRNLIDNLGSALLSQTISDGHEELHAFIAQFVAIVKQHLSMADLTGKDVSGYASNFSPGGFVGFLSPLEKFFQIYLPGTDERKLYQILNYMGYLSPETVTNLDSHFDIAWTGTIPDASGSYPTIHFSMPPSQDWWEGLAHFYGETIPNNDFGYLNSAVTKTFPQYGSSFSDAVNLAKTTLSQIVDKTISLFTLQIDIDKAETDLATFITDNSDFAKTEGINLSDLLKDLEAESEQPDAVATPAQVMAPAAPKSKTPWLIAAAAAIWFVTNKDK